MAWRLGLENALWQSSRRTVKRTAAKFLPSPNQPIPILIAQLDQGNNRNATLSAVTAHYFNGGKEISTEATEVSLTESKAGLKVTWEGGFGDTFSHAFLRSYAPIVGKCISEEQPEYFTHNPLNAEFQNDLWVGPWRHPVPPHAPLAQVSSSSFHMTFGSLYAPKKQQQFGVCHKTAKLSFKPSLLLRERWLKRFSVGKQRAGRSVIFVASVWIGVDSWLRTATPSTFPSSSGTTSSPRVSSMRSSAMRL